MVDCIIFSDFCLGIFHLSDILDLLVQIISRTIPPINFLNESCIILLFLILLTCSLYFYPTYYSSFMELLFTAVPVHLSVRPRTMFRQSLGAMGNAKRMEVEETKFWGDDLHHLLAMGVVLHMVM